jgi:hypothetical protein
MNFTTAATKLFGEPSPILLVTEDSMRRSVKTLHGRRAAKSAKLGVHATEHLVAMTVIGLFQDSFPKVHALLGGQAEDTLENLCSRMITTSRKTVAPSPYLPIAIERVLQLGDALEGPGTRAFEATFALVHHLAPDLCPLFESLGPIRALDFIPEVSGFLTGVETFIELYAAPIVRDISWPAFPALAPS